ncbi:PulJ/GspJ family protein [Klebsiella aerogenes]|nr:prepilin-type N-terminal cleavage/methylation domain-containing protein [Klebsiella aerogenes]KZR11295.1 hypothetical protein A3N65_12425 [Klebsiella aerogenes]
MRFSQNDEGFTMIEMIIAILIFSVVSLCARQLFLNMKHISTITDKYNRQTADFLLAEAQLTDDLSQLQIGKNTPLIVTAGTNDCIESISFTTRNVANADQSRVFGEGLVTWSVKDHKLQRVAISVRGDTHRHTVIQNMKCLRIRYYENGIWQDVHTLRKRVGRGFAWHAEFMNKLILERFIPWFS